MLRLIALATLLSTTAAFAQPGAEDPPAPPPAPTVRPPEPQGFLAGGFTLGADHLMNGAMLLEGGVRLPNTSVWLHGIASRGDAFDFEGGGSYLRGMGGVELRSASAGSFVFVDLDVGYQRQTWSDDTPMDDERHEGLVVGPRFGFDLGGSSAGGVRVRGALELYEYHRHSHDSTGDSVAWSRGGGLVFSVGYQF